MTLCVYALVPRPRGRGARLPRVHGMDDERLRLIGAGAVQAVAGSMRRLPPVTPDAMRRYDRTVRELASSLPALLPARFGTGFDDPGELEFVLRSRAESFQRALRHVRGRAQMTVRIAGVAETHSPVAPAAVTHGSGSRYLRARAEAAAHDRRVAGFESVKDAVERWVRDERVEKRGSVATVYHLVPRASADAYRARAERAAAAAGLQVIVTGPWPPYAFARW